MAQAEAVLDALVWAQYKEPARVAKIAAKLVRNVAGRHNPITKAAIADAVRETMPPHGRGKAIVEAVTVEYARQLVIWQKRQEQHHARARYKERYVDKIDGRLHYALNAAYASRFGRPVFLPSIDCPYQWADVRREAWLAVERDRDKGDKCIGLMLFQDTVVVALLASVHAGATRGGGYHIATIDRDGGSPIYTALQSNCEDFSQAAICLGGPQVRGAFTRGIPAFTDWRGRRTIIHYPNKSVELPWHALKYLTKKNNFIQAVDVTVIGQVEIEATVVDGSDD